MHLYLSTVLDFYISAFYNIHVYSKVHKSTLYSYIQSCFTECNIFSNDSTSLRVIQPGNEPYGNDEIRGGFDFEPLDHLSHMSNACTF